MKVRLIVAGAVVLLGVAGSTPAFAGESTGNFSETGKTTPVATYVMQSICAFSGQNPEAFLPPEDEHYEPGRTQSWGKIPKAVRDSLPTGYHPGSSCNGHTGFIASGGEE